MDENRATKARDIEGEVWEGRQYAASDAHSPGRQDASAFQHIDL